MARRVALALAALALATGASDPKTASVHVVDEGETLTGIAGRADVPASVIAEANGLREPYHVRAGQKLVIPRQRIHTVKAGETGYAIAKKHGVPFAQVAIANGLDDKATIRPGQKLIIPAVVAAPDPTTLTPSPPGQPYFRRPHDGRVLLGFGVRADGKGHDGIDYAAAPLDMVRAAASGTVSGISHYHPRLGRMVTIDHGQGWKSAYGHLARITVKMGDVVKTGERIGLAGSPSGTREAEVHFTIRRDERPVDPASVLAR
ncbi:LysM peptidoglycan-binding domain-containing protein [Tsuneonella sp. SYSU-LHT278]|uniref:LysM peptidoglycan-binding domain-containing protein n=1 Tax=Tsuneonella sediminis TaxID=3416089 RepID=UPI003F7AC0DD